MLLGNVLMQILSVFVTLCLNKLSVLMFSVKKIAEGFRGILYMERIVLM